MSVITVIFVLMLFGRLGPLAAQSSEECGTTFNCYTSPEDCFDQSTQNASACNFLFKFRPHPSDQTLVMFVLKARVHDPAQAYLAIGFTTHPKMSNSSIVMCKFNAAQGMRAVEHYYTPSKERPTVIDEGNRQLGLSDIEVNMSDDLLVCSFSRKKYAGPIYRKKFFDIGLNDTFYLIAAKGNLDDEGLEPTRHYSHAASRFRINFNERPFYQKIFVEFSKIRCFLLILTGVLLNALNMNLPRYTMLLFSKRNNNLKESWWLILIQVLALTISIISLALIIHVLAFNAWNFNTFFAPNLLILSAIGITTLALTILQILAVFSGSAAEALEGGLCWIHPSTIITIITLALFPLSVLTIFCAAYDRCSSEITHALLFWIFWHSALYLRIPCSVKRSKVSSSAPGDQTLQKKSAKIKFQLKFVLLMGHFAGQVVITTFILYNLLSRVLY